MTIKLTIDASKRSTYIGLADFYDEHGSAATPKSANWTLTDAGGSIVNSRNNVSFSPLSSTCTAVLWGADTTLFGANDSGQRVFTVEAIYDSDIGINLPINDEARFEIERLEAIED
jgi:hypothetical protein